MSLKAVLCMLWLGVNPSQAADANCTAARTKWINIMENPCLANGTACAATCMPTMSEALERCAGKSYNDTDGPKQFEGIGEAAVAIVFADKPCKGLIENKARTLVTSSCKSAFAFFSLAAVLGHACNTAAGGPSNSSCDPKCQEAITAVFSNCKDGDYYTDTSSDKFNSASGALAMKLLGPGACSYSAGAGKGTNSVDVAIASRVTCLTLLLTTMAAVVSL
eukprot:TRINITY_DN109692_c0_g1_i1.p1 TRINITY_DN109692_c0_g1~~TRINITY_DN109692_c0_g1_i1.p1  ORF type:complete len:243 (+),score=30.56 TRINITY_DN109692_c0_g1_i1:67-729(+)